MKKVKKIYLIKNRHDKQTSKGSLEKNIGKLVIQQAHKAIEISLKQKSNVPVSLQREI